MEALKKKNKSLTAQLKYKESARRAGFAMFYSEKTKNFTLNLENKKLYKKLLDDGDKEGLPIHIISELKELYTKTSKLCECPICLEEMNPDDMVFSSCGHLYDKKCYDKLCAMNDAKCAICRRKIYTKKSS